MTTKIHHPLPGASVLMAVATTLLGAATDSGASVWTRLVGGNASGTWGVASNWSGGIPDGADAIADFSNLDITADSSVTNELPRVVGNLRFADLTPGRNWTLSGQPLMLAVGSGMPEITVVNRTATLGVTLTGSQGFNKYGAGLLLLTAANTVTGPIHVNAGTLGCQTGASLKDVTGLITVDDGATFDARQGFDAHPIANDFILGGSGAGATYGALNIRENATLTGNITLTSDTKITHDWNIATLAGGITGTDSDLQLTTLQSGQYGFYINGLIRLGNGSLTLTGIGTTGSPDLTLSGSHNSTGATTVTSGKLVLSGGGSLDDASALLLSSRDSVFSISSITAAGEIIGSLAGVSGASVLLGSKQLTAGGDGSSTTFAGGLSGAGGSFAKAGGGTLTLAGINTYTGGTTLAGGRIVIPQLNALGSGPITFNADSTLQTTSALALTQTLMIGPGATATLDFPVGTVSTHSGALTGSGTLTKTGLGSLTLSGGANNTLTGGIAVSRGTLACDNGASLKNVDGTISVAAGATLDLQQGFDAYSISNPLVLAGPGAGTSYGALNLRENVTLTGDITLTADTKITHDWNNAAINGPITGGNYLLELAALVAGQGPLIVNGNIQLGSGVLTKTGVAPVILNGTNTFGGVAVNAGVLLFKSLAASGAAGTDLGIQAGAVAALGGSGMEILLSRTSSAAAGSIAFNGGISSVALDFSNHPTLGLGAYANSTYNGVITPSGGNYRFGGGGATLTVGSILSGENGLIIRDTQGGKVVLSGQHSQSGPMVVIAGTLAVDGSLTGPITVESAGTLAPGPVGGIGNLNVSQPVTVAGSLTMRIDRGGSQTADLLTAPELTLVGTLTVLNQGTAPQAGDSFHLFDISGELLQTNVTLNLPALSTGLTWDVGSLLADGTLRVTALTQAVGDPGWPQLLQGQIAAVKAAGFTSVSVNPGTYHMPDTGTSSFTFTSWSDFTIDATGSLFTVGKQRAFSLVNCTNVTLRGPVIRTRIYPFTQGRVLENGNSSDGSAYAIWRISDGYADTFTWWFNAINQTTRNIDLETGDLYYDAANATYQSDGTWKLGFPGKTTLPFQINDWLVARSGSQGFAVYLSGCRDCTVESVTSQSGGFGTFRETGGGGNRILDCRIELSPDPPPGGTEPPVVSCSADGIHTNNTYPGLHVEDCVFEGAMLDDNIAIHGSFVTVLDVLGNTLILDGPGLFAVNDAVRMSGSAGFFAQAICTAIAIPGDGTFRVTLDQTLAVPIGARASNPKFNGAGFRIINCQLGNTRSRAIITKADDGLISGCTIARSGTAINIGPEYYWNESDYSWNVTVSGNTISDCGAGVSVVQDGAIGNRNVSVIDNSFSAITRKNCISIQGCDGVTLTGNSFDRHGSIPAIGFKMATNIQLANNLVDYAAGTATMLGIGTGVTNLSGVNNGIFYSGRAHALTNVSSNLLLANPDNGTAGTPLRQSSECNAAGRWIFEPTGGGYCRILSAANHGLAVGVDDSASSDAPLVLENVDSSDSQLWKLLPSGTTAVSLIHKSSGLVATVESSVRGETVIQTTHAALAGQAWVPAVNDFTYADWNTNIDPSHDDDCDGLVNLMEYALCSDPALPLPAITASGSGESLSLAFNRRIAATDLVFRVEHSTDLIDWRETAVPVSSAINPDGTAAEVWRCPELSGGATSGYLRLRVNTVN